MTNKLVDHFYVKDGSDNMVADADLSSSVLDAKDTLSYSIAGVDAGSTSATVSGATASGNSTGTVDLTFNDGTDDRIIRITRSHFGPNNDGKNKIEVITGTSESGLHIVTFWDGYVEQRFQFIVGAS